MRCEQVRSRLGAYADGELGGEIREGLEAHLAACRVCAGEMASLRALGTLLGGLPAPPVPAGLESSILDAAARHPLGTRRTPRLWSSVLRVAAAILVALAGAYLGARSSGLPAAAVEMARAPGGDSVESLYEQSFALLPADSPGAGVLALYEEEGR